MNYTTMSTGNSDPGFGIGIGQVTPEQPGMAVFYIESQDIQADLKAIQSKGGQAVDEPMDIPGVGTIAFFKDPAGNLMAIANFIPEAG